jgi:hypothetical protein
MPANAQISRRTPRHPTPIGNPDIGGDAGFLSKMLAGSTLYRSKLRCGLCSLRVFVDQSVEDLPAADPRGGEAGPVSVALGGRW